MAPRGSRKDNAISSPVASINKGIPKQPKEKIIDETHRAFRQQKYYHGVYNNTTDEAERAALWEKICEHGAILLQRLQELNSLLEQSQPAAEPPSEAERAAVRELATSIDVWRSSKTLPEDNVVIEKIERFHHAVQGPITRTAPSHEPFLPKKYDYRDLAMPDYREPEPADDYAKTMSEAMMDVKDKLLDPPDLPDSAFPSGAVGQLHANVMRAHEAQMAHYAAHRKEMDEREIMLDAREKEREEKLKEKEKLLEEREAQLQEREDNLAATIGKESKDTA